MASFGGMLTIIQIPAYDGWNLFLGFLPNLILITSGIVLWTIAPWLSRLVTTNGNREFTSGGVTREDLFTAVLLSLGVYFIMDSFSNVLGWAHYFAVNRSERGFHMNDVPSYYDLTERVLTLIGGIVLVVACRTCGRRLAPKYTSEQDAPSNR